MPTRTLETPGLTVLTSGLATARTTFPSQPNTENFFPRVFTNDSGDPTGTGIAADIVVLVRFQDPPALKSSDGKTTLSECDR